MFRTPDFRRTSSFISKVQTLIVLGVAGVFLLVVVAISADCADSGNSSHGNWTNTQPHYDEGLVDDDMEMFLWGIGAGAAVRSVWDRDDYRRRYDREYDRRYPRRSYNYSPPRTITSKPYKKSSFGGSSSRTGFRSSSRRR